MSCETETVLYLFGVYTKIGLRYTTDMYRFRPLVNEAQKELWGDMPFPPRTIVEVSRLNQVLNSFVSKITQSKALTLSLG